MSIYLVQDTTFKVVAIRIVFFIFGVMCGYAWCWKALN